MRVRVRRMRGDYRVCVWEIYSMIIDTAVYNTQYNNRQYQSPPVRGPTVGRMECMTGAATSAL